MLNFKEMPDPIKPKRARYQAVFGIIVVAVALMIAFLFKFVGVDGGFGRNYASGMVIFEDFNSCGILKTRTQDWLRCRVSAEACGDLRNYANKRIRVSGVETKCDDHAAMQCSYTKDFNEAGFEAKLCMTDMKIIQVYESLK